MRHRFLLLSVVLSASTALLAQGGSPELSLTANGGQSLSLYPGWPLIVHATIMNSQRFSQSGNPAPLVISPNGNPWTTAIQLTAVSSSGQLFQWPFTLIGTPANAALTLSSRSYVRLAFQMSGADVSTIAPDTYQLIASLQVTNSTGWNGLVQSKPITIQIGPEPALSAGQQSQKALLNAEFSTNAGNLSDALASVQQLAQAQPSNSAAWSAAANLLELAGLPELAFFHADRALTTYFQANPSLYDPPSNLLTVYQRLSTALVTPVVESTNIVGSPSTVTFTPSNQNVTLTATLSVNGPNQVQGGTVTFTLAGIGNPATSGPVIQGNATAVFTIPGGTAVGSYVIQASYSGTPAFKPSTDSTGVLMIKKATPTISWSMPADINYGTALSPTQLNAIPSVAGNLVYSPPAGTVLPAGPSQALTMNFTPSDLTDYNTAIAQVFLNVDAPSLTITANSFSRQYGQPNPSFTVSYNGFVNGDSSSALSGALACTTPGTTSSPAGNYPITCFGLTSTNYAITYAPGQLTVTSAPLTITANNASRQVSQPNPGFTVSYIGFVNGDTSSALSGSLTCLTTATVNSPVGTYPINCSGLSSTNYMITYAPGQLTVTPVPCVPNVTASVSVTRSGFSYSPISKKYAQTLTLTNTSGAAVVGPIYVVLDSLSSNATLSNANGSTSCGTPIGSPYISITGTLNPGATTTVVLQFSDPSNTAISYMLRMLAGAGQP